MGDFVRYEIDYFDPVVQRAGQQSSTIHERRQRGHRFMVLRATSQHRSGERIPNTNFFTTLLNSNELNEFTFEGCELGTSK